VIRDEQAYYTAQHIRDNARAQDDAATLSGMWDVEPRPDTARDARLDAEFALRDECARRGDLASEAYIAQHAAAYDAYGDAWRAAFEAERATQEARRRGSREAFVAARLAEAVAWDRARAQSAAMREVEPGRIAAQSAAWRETEAALRPLALALEAYTLARLSGRGKYILTVGRVFGRAA
jgi:hypothetical protein